MVEGLGIAEDVGKQEVEERPQFMQVVLQWGTSDQKAITRLEKPDDLRQGRLLVLDTMGLLNVR